MSFQPVVPLSGYAGWAFLQRTMDQQKDAFDASPVRQREDSYFREKIGSITSAEELVADRRLLNVALGAFGLEGDTGNTFFIRKVLEEGATDRSALANRLSDKRYLALTEAFGFGTAAPNTTSPDFADKILARHADQTFEAAVGEQNPDMRLALNAHRELPELAARETSELTRWYGVLGSEPLRRVFQTALGLPTSFASLDLDQQVRQMRDKFEGVMKTESLSTFDDPAQVDRFMKRFLTMSQVSGSGGPAVTSPALQLLQAQGSAVGILSLLR